MAKFNFFRIFSIVLIILLTSCQLKEPSKNHGILFLENRAEKLIVGKDNKNDILRKIGNPHISTNKKDNRWIYIERVLTKGSIHKIGQNVLKTNNLLVLNFDKYGILNEKLFLDKDELNKLNFSKKFTENDLSKKSFIAEFLNSIKTKMYSNRK